MPPSDTLGASKSGGTGGSGTTTVVVRIPAVLVLVCVWVEVVFEVVSTDFGGSILIASPPVSFPLDETFVTNHGLSNWFGGAIAIVEKETRATRNSKNPLASV